MKTYDEIVVNVVEATAAHRRKVRKIQQIAATSAMCAVCVFGLTVYMNLEPQQSLPEPSETETQTVTVTGVAALPTETEETAGTDIPETVFTEESFHAATAESTAASSQEESRFTETRPAETSAVIPDTTNPPETQESIPVTTAQTTRNSTRPTSEQTEAWTTGRTVTTPPVQGTTFHIPNIDYTESETSEGDAGQAPTDPWTTPANTTVSDTTTTTTTTTTATMS